MKHIHPYFIICILLVLISCNSKKESETVTEAEKLEIRKAITAEIEEGVEATRIKDVELYMSQMPKDLVIYNEHGDTISREEQREYALRDWGLIDTTLRIMMRIDSIQFVRKDSVVVFTYQEWERMMFQRDGVTTDTIFTNQRHKETWKKKPIGWYGYEVVELGGTIYINGTEYNPE